MKRLFTLLLISFAALSCEMIDEKLDDLLDKRDWVVFAEGTELTVDVPSKQTVLNYKFESTLDWKLATESEWLEIDPTKGKAGKDIKIQIKVRKNKDKEGRTGYVDLTLSNDESYRITINQAGEGDVNDEGDENENENENENEGTIVDIPTNQIWYTTTTGEIVVPNNDPYESNSTIISNTYTDGQGIITFRDNVVEIADFFLTYNDVLETLTLPSTLTRIGSHAFADCTTLSRINIPKSVTYIENSAFDYDQIATVIYEGSYDDWFNIYFETRGSNPVHNGGDLYIDGEPLCGEVIVPSYITDLGHFFTGISAETFILHDKITTISQKAFEDCKALKYITIPESVEIIEDGAFADCISLESVYCKPTIPPYLGCEVFILIEEEPCFTNIGNTIYVPVASYYDYINAEGWREYAKYIVAYDYDRNEVVDIERPEKPNEIANNQIWYTSLYNDTIYPYDSEAFNAEIVSNIYYGDYGVITFDGELTEIGDYAFAHCGGLRSLSLPESVTSVGECLIKDCPTFESFGGKFATEDGTSLIANDTLVACAQNTSSDLYIIPDGVKRIATCAFRECENISKIVIPQSVESIGEGAFSSSLGIQSFEGKFVTDDSLAVICDNTLIGYAHGNPNRSYAIPEGVTRIGWYALDNSIYLEEVTIPETVTEIGDVSFAFCYDLQRVYCKPTTPPIALLDDNMGWEAFNYNGYQMQIYVPAESYQDYISAEGWSEYADRIIAEGSIPEDTQTSIIRYTTIDGEPITPRMAVKSNTYINGEGILEFYGNIIGDSAFYRCDSLTSITIGDSVTTIGSNAFQDCSSLTSVTIPDSVTTVGGYAFSGCGNLNAVYITDLVAWCNIDFVNPINNGFQLEANPLLYAQNLYLNGELITELVIPESVTDIKFLAFTGCSASNIVFHDNVKSIGACAFERCQNLENVVIGNSVESIGNVAFGHCPNLTSVTMSDSLTSFGFNVFLDSSNLREFKGKLATEDGRALIRDNILFTYANASGLEYTIPDGITIIGDGAFFSSVGLKSITIPESITTIGYLAFGMDTDIESIYCKATTPPSTGGNIYQSNSCNIYVPADSYQDYVSAEGWSQYAASILPYDYDNNCVVEVDPSEETKRWLGKWSSTVSRTYCPQTGFNEETVTFEVNIEHNAVAPNFVKVYGLSVIDPTIAVDGIVNANGDLEILNFNYIGNSGEWGLYVWALSEAMSLSPDRHAVYTMSMDEGGNVSCKVGSYNSSPYILFDIFGYNVNTGNVSWYNTNISYYSGPMSWVKMADNGATPSRSLQKISYRHNLHPQADARLRVVE